jgi:hypothetical protein
MVLGASLKDGTLTEDDRRWNMFPARSQPGADRRPELLPSGADRRDGAAATQKLVAPPSNEASLTSMPPLISGSDAGHLGRERYGVTDQQA